MKDFAIHKAVWTIRKYANDQDFENGNPFEIAKIEGNVLLNEGIAVLQTLLIGTGGTPWSNANAYLGVGDSATAAAASQTGLQAATNKTYMPMEASYPSVASQTTTWRAVFGSGDANFDWNEFTIVNASTDTGDNLNRKVSVQGTKASGQTWTLDLAITWS